MRLPLLVILLLVLVASACGPDYLMRQRQEINAEGWAYADTLVYTFTIADTLQIYNLHIGLEHSKTYPFQNLYTQIHTTFPDGERLSETLSLELADKAGHWLGDCGQKNCHIDIPIQQGAFFNQPGPYQITIEQYMRQDSLPGIEWLQFGVEKTADKRS